MFGRGPPKRAETSSSDAPLWTAAMRLSAERRMRSFQAAFAAGSPRSASVIGGTFTNTTESVARGGRRNWARFAR